MRAERDLEEARLAQVDALSCAAWRAVRPQKSPPEPVAEALVVPLGPREHSQPRRSRWHRRPQGVLVAHRLYFEAGMDVGVVQERELELAEESLREL